MAIGKIFIEPDTSFSIFVKRIVFVIIRSFRYKDVFTLFTFIQALDKAVKGKFIPTRLYYAMEKNAMQRFSMDHEVHDDEMKGIRNITGDYMLLPKCPLHVKVLYNELKAFEKSLITHARIENEILFPKAMMLENQVKKMLAAKTQFN